MNKFPIITSLLMVLGIVGSVFISQEMGRERKKTIYAANAARLDTLVYLPTMGMDKFWADLNWIRLVQVMGNPDTALKPPKSNDKASVDAAKDAARYFYDQIDYISSLNPDFVLLYKFAPLYIANILPEEAITLLQKGNDYSVKKDYNRDWYSSIIVDQYLNEDPRNPSKENQERSIAYLEKIINNDSGYPFHIYSRFLGKQMTKNNVNRDNPLAVLIAESEYYKNTREKMLKEYKKQNAKSAEEAKAAAAAAAKDGVAPEAGAIPEDMAAMGPEGMMGPDGMGMDSLSMLGGDMESPLGKLAERIKQSCSNLAIEKKLAMRLLKDTDPERAKLEAEHKQIRKIYEDVTKYAEESHVSPFSLRKIEPGEVYDVWTGDELPQALWYGFDIDYYLDKGVIVKLRGTFSPVTGNESK